LRSSPIATVDWLTADATAEQAGGRSTRFVGELVPDDVAFIGALTSDGKDGFASRSSAQFVAGHTKSPLDPPFASGSIKQGGILEEP
jgi:hypothetical protein